MYQSQLLDAYKKAQNYVQDKQIAHDLNVNASRISEMRKGRRYISDAEAVFLAENAGIDPAIALVGCHADRNENPTIRGIWEELAKKYNGLGLSRFSMICGALVLWMSDIKVAIAKCALCEIMLNSVSYQLHIESFNHKELYDALSKNEQELHFS